MPRSVSSVSELVESAGAGSAAVAAGRRLMRAVILPSRPVIWAQRPVMSARIASLSASLLPGRASSCMNSSSSASPFSISALRAYISSIPMVRAMVVVDGATADGGIAVGTLDVAGGGVGEIPLAAVVCPVENRCCANPTSPCASSDWLLRCQFTLHRRKYWNAPTLASGQLPATAGRIVRLESRSASPHIMFRMHSRQNGATLDLPIWIFDIPVKPQWHIGSRRISSISPAFFGASMRGRCTCGVTGCAACIAARTRRRCMGPFGLLIFHRNRNCQLHRREPSRYPPPSSAPLPACGGARQCSRCGFARSRPSLWGDQGLRAVGGLTRL